MILINYQYVLLVLFVFQVGRNALKNSVVHDQSFCRFSFIVTHIAIFFSFFKTFSIHRALVKSMDEILFMCGDKKRAVIATLNVVGLNIEGFAKNEVRCSRLDINVL